MRKLMNVAVLSCKATTYKYCKYDCHVLQEEHWTKSTFSLKIQDSSCLWFLAGNLIEKKSNHYTSKAGIQLPLPLTRWSSQRPKATIIPWNQEFSCLCHWPDETRQAQRQPLFLEIKNSVASALDPMKFAKLKGNHHASKAGIQLPLPLTRWNSPEAKATNRSKKQEFSCFCLNFINIVKGPKLREAVLLLSAC